MISASAVPFDGEAIGNHVIEQSSRRVPGTLAHRDELWNQRSEDVMDRIRIFRAEEEIARLGDNYSSALAESLNSKHDAVNG